MIKKIITKIALAAMLVLPLGIAMPTVAAGPATWDTTGSYNINVNYASVDYPETLVLAQTGSNITGTSLDTVPPGSLFTVTGGTVSANIVDLNATNGSLAITMNGTIALNGSMSGTWADVTPGTRTGTWASTSGAALPLGTLAAEDFGVVNYDTGLGFLKGYTAGFGVTDETFAGATSVVVKLYSAGDVLLQTNTAILPKFNTDVTGTQFSSPFDVSGNFDYATDGYWTNVRETQFGQSVPAVKVVATVTLENGKVVTAENTTVAGDPTTIYPVAANVITNPATAVVTNDAMLNGTNGPSAATGHSFWVSLSPFVTTSPSIPVGVYSTPDMGAIAANMTFSSTLSSITTAGVPSNLPMITPNTQYYFAAWSNVGGTWYPGEVLNFTTGAVVTPPTTSTISGMKFNDLNRNGVKDAGEVGLQGWVIRLLSDGTADDDTLVATATTDVNGNYSFTNVAPGTYDVRETHQKGWKRMSKNPKDIVITSGSTVTGVDFGNAMSKKGEKDDNNKDDNRDEQSGSYYSHHDKSNYGNDQGKKDHKDR